ncbi:thiamine pyrophosphate-binding protein [Solibacillus sp. CAU 1738]|uniref:thiamine pyrophosphate-binding protein n=1 Tax=Solibacillus sp. CAU 1738 TaxID=3140363 RepID=UPI00326095C4
MKKVAEIIAENLKNMGVRHVFGVPGKAVVPLMLNLEDAGIKFNLARHEGGAGYIASGYSLMNNSIGVAIGTSGPGGTNLLTAAAQAKAWHLPVVFITGQPSVKGIGNPFGQDSTPFGTDLVKMFEPVTKYSARIDRAESFKNHFTHAIKTALFGVKGPVHLSIPADVLLEETESFILEIPNELPHVVATPNMLQKALDCILSAKRPVIILGKGVHSSKAYEEVIRFAETFHIPVMTTPGGKGTFPTTHPLSLDGFGLGGSTKSTEFLKKQCDLMIVLGSKLSDMSFVGIDPSLYPNKVIHFDYDHTFIGKSIPVETHYVLGDLKNNLDCLLASFKGNLKHDTTLLHEHVEMDALNTSSSDRLLAKEVIGAIRKALPEDTVFFGDDGSHSFFAIQNLQLPKPATFYFDDVFGAMGHAIGFSIGAKIGNPDKNIVCLTGDGCFFMHGNEISTAADNHVATKFIVLNNGRLDMVDKGMSKNVGKAVGTLFKNELNVKQFSEAMGALAFRCWTIDELQTALQEALNHSTGPTVIEVMVDQEEIPPTLMRG